MELRILKYFLVVAREENITKAAELLHITQPTLSRQLAQLEEELGVKLFKRGQHSIILTEDGMLLKRRAQEIIELSERTEKELSHVTEHLSGEIAIGSGETKNLHGLARIMANFRKEHPDVSFHMYSSVADDIKERMEKGLIDIGLLTEPVDISRYDFIRMPEKEKWGVLVRKDSSLAKKGVIYPKDLVGIPIIISKRQLVQNELASWFGEYYDQMEIASTYNLAYNAAIMVENNVGVALCFHFENRFENLAFCPLSPELETGSVLVWKKYQGFSTTTKAFIEYIQKCL